MKKLITILLLAAFCLGGCKKNDDGNNISSAPNVVTLTIDDKEYKATGNMLGQGNFDKVECSVTKHSDGTADFYLSVFIMGGGNSDFTMVMDTEKGAGNGLGAYAINGNGTFTERFSGGESYKIAGGTVTITKNATNLIEGSVTLSLTNTTRNKTVSGSFRIADPLN